MDLEEIALFLNMDVSDMKVIQAQYGRLGQQWITTAGTSSGPWLGIGLCCAVAGSGSILHRRRKKQGAKKVAA